MSQKFDIFKFTILDTASLVSMARELGLWDAISAMYMGDFEGGLNLFVNGLASVFESQGTSGVLRILLKYLGTKLIIGALPGASKKFKFGPIELSIV